MTAHTPAPWKVSLSAGRYTYYVVSSDRKVCRIQHGTKANAHLIAAAPEMYEALKTIKQGFDKFLCEVNLSDSFLSAESLAWLNETSLKTDAAIAKAEGKV